MKLLGTVLVALVAAVLLAPPALAYLDPGSGSMMLQLLVGGIAGLVVLLRLFWGRVLRFFGLRKPEPPSDAPGPS